MICKSVQLCMKTQCLCVWQQYYIYFSSSCVSLFDQSCGICQFSDVTLRCWYTSTGWSIWTSLFDCFVNTVIYCDTN